MTKDERRTFRPARMLWAGPCLVCLLTGCATASWEWLPWKKSEPAGTQAGGPKDSFVLRGGNLERGAGAGVDSPLYADLDGAKRQFQNKEYGPAERTFHKLANNKKAPVNLLDEALFYEAECQRLQNNLRDAEGTYRKYVREFHRNGQHVEQANRRLFDIANYWLSDTRKQMEAWEEQREGKRWLVLPASYFHVSKDRPFLDMEGHALQILEDVAMMDYNGAIRTVDGGPSVGEQALFYLATVKFFRQDYREADAYYKQLYERHPNSSMAPKAIKQSIICKQIMNGGTDYDTRTVEESRKLIDRYQTAYPEWNKDRDWLTRQLGSVHLQQADRDFKIAEFYRRTSHPGSAYFYYELVRRRYPNTEYATKADERMRELRGVAEREHGVAATKSEPVTEKSPNAFSQPPAPVDRSTPSAPKTLPSPSAPSMPSGLQRVAAPAAPEGGSTKPAALLPPSAPGVFAPLPGAAPPSAPPANLLAPTPTAGPVNAAPQVQEPLPIAPSTTPRLLPPNGGPGGY